MSTWIGFLRAVNLGARRKFPAAEVRTCVEALGFTDVATHINTGNVRFSTTMHSRERITERLEAAFAADRGFDVPVVLLTPAELQEVVDSLDEVAAGHDGAHYVSLLRAKPGADAVAALEGLEFPGERVMVRGRTAHTLMGPDVHRSKLSNGLVERHAGTATSRNRTVLAAIAGKWC